MVLDFFSYFIEAFSAECSCMFHIQSWYSATNKVNGLIVADITTFFFFFLDSSASGASISYRSKILLIRLNTQ